VRLRSANKLQAPVDENQSEPLKSNTGKKMPKRFCNSCLFLLLITISILMFAAPVMAEEEAKPPLLPPITGSESAQTYMQAVWVVIIFVIMLAILYPTAWKNVLAGLKKREDRIRQDIADAESARSKAESSLKEYNARLATAETQVRDLITKAAADAEKIAAGIRMRGQQEAEEIKERALKDIDASRKQALSEIYEQAANLSTSIAEKILKRNLNVDDQRDLVNESLEQLQSLNT
jgi:F-type H+-transporting ATPase subunit b